MGTAFAFNLMTLSGSRMHMLISPDKKLPVILFHNGNVKLKYHVQKTFGCLHAFCYGLSVSIVFHQFLFALQRDMGMSKLPAPSNHHQAITDHSHTAIRGQLVTLITCWCAAWSGFFILRRDLHFKPKPGLSNPNLFWHYKAV